MNNKRIRLCRKAGSLAEWKEFLESNKKRISPKIEESKENQYLLFLTSVLERCDVRDNKLPDPYSKDPQERQDAQYRFGLLVKKNPRQLQKPHRCEQLKLMYELTLQYGYPDFFDFTVIDNVLTPV